MFLTKTDYLIYRDCPKNAWLKMHNPDVYYKKPPSLFDQMIMDTGNDVDLLARSLFPGGVTIEGRDDTELTMSLIQKNTSIIYQPVFVTDKFKAIGDILVWNKDVGAYDIFEVKSSNSGDDKKAKDEIYAHDLAFQYVVSKSLGVSINRTYIVRLNSEYVRGAELDISELFTQEDFTERVKAVLDKVTEEMNDAYNLVQTEEEPHGSCSCIVKGRSRHCTTFSYSNPDVPDYSVHDISRIGSSPKKLAELVDSKIFSILDVPEGFVLTLIQRNQVDAAQSGRITLDSKKLKDFFDQIKFPISFLDYETFPAAIPRFIGYKPYDQIPFQFSLHIINDDGLAPEHFEFIFTEKTNPDVDFIEALKKYLPESGSIIVWNKQFETGINKKLGFRNNDCLAFLESINDRVVDLEVPFKDQHYVHPGFKGKSSIKNVLPTLVPELSYKELDIQEGATASDTWNKIVTDQYDEDEASKKRENLLTYCGLDTYAMYAIWKHCIDKLK